MHDTREPSTSPALGVIAGVLVLLLGAGGYAAYRMLSAHGAAVEAEVQARQLAALAAESRAQTLRAEKAYLGAPPLPFATRSKSDRPLHTVSKYPPRTRIPVANLPKVTQGIPCPDGSFLPFLNGMTWAPPLQRDPGLGPVPPVVAIQVDDAGIEWWEHADGSVTTCHYHEITALGQKYFDPVTRHGAAKPSSQILGLDQGVEDPKQGPGGQPPKR